MAETSKTLWQRFTFSVVWIVEDLLSAVRVIPRAEFCATPFSLLDTETGTIDPPSITMNPNTTPLPSGVCDVRGLKTVNLTHRQYNPTGDSIVSLWVHDGEAWAYLGDVTLTGETGVLPPLDLEGFHYLLASVDMGNINAGNGITLRCTPHNN